MESPAGEALILPGRPTARCECGKMERRRVEEWLPEKVRRRRHGARPLGPRAGGSTGSSSSASRSGPSRRWCCRRKRTGARGGRRGAAPPAAQPRRQWRSRLAPPLLVAEDRSTGGSSPPGSPSSPSARSAAAAQKAFRLDTDMPLDRSCRRVFEVAVELSRNMGCSIISPEHLTITLFTLDHPTTNNLVRSLGADPSQLASVAPCGACKDGRDPAGASSLKVPEKAAAGAGTSAFSKSLSKKKDKGALDQLCLDLTTQAPIIGRKKEIERVVQIICGRPKNNPILLGEVGVGKTSIAEGLALRIANGDVPILPVKLCRSIDLRV